MSIITMVETMRVRQFNHQAMIKWQDAVDKWHEDRFTHNIIPQIMMYGFRTRTGDLRKVGFVAVIGKAQYWAKTRKEAIKRALNK